MKAPKVLFPFCDGFEEIEFVAPVDLLRRAGAEVVLAGLVCSTCSGRSGLTISADALLAEVDTSSFDALVIAGGPGVKQHRVDGRTAEMAKDFVSSGKPVAAICAAPLILKDAGLLDGIRFTAHSSTVNELPAALASERVVEDGLIITSRGAGTALDFALHLVERLVGQDQAGEVAKGIMA